MSGARRLAPWAIVAAFVVLGVLYALLTPLFEAPDESSHLQVIAYIAAHRRLYAPVLLPERITSGTAMADSLRFHEPPLYYTPPLYHGLAALLVAWTPMTDLQERLVPNPAWEMGWSPQRDADPENKNVFVHLPGETWAESPTWRAALVLRFFSVACGAVTVLGTFWIARLLFPEQPGTALAAMALVAFNPQFVSISASVTNDPFLIALSTLFVWLALRAMRGRAGWRRWAALGALAGVGLWVKQSALLWLPVGALAILGQVEAGEPWPWRKLLADGLSLGLAALAVGCAWYVHNGLRYGDWFGLQAHFVSQMTLASFGFRELLTVFETYWAGFGWALISVPCPVYAILGIAVALALGGLLWMMLGSAWKSLAPFTRRGLGVLAALWLLNALSLARWAIATGSPYGRLLFPSQAAAGVFLAAGLAQWGRGRFQFVIPELAVGLLGLFAVLVPWLVLRPALASPQIARLPAAAQLLDAMFAGGPALRGYRVTPPDGETLSPGNTLRLTLFWEALQATQPRYRTWVQLGPQDATQYVAGDDIWLGGTRYPADVWQAGDLVQQVHRLELPAQVPFGLYWLRLGLSDEDGERVALAGGDAQVTLGPWRVRPAASGTPAYLLDVSLGEAIRLRGYDISLANTLVVTLTWEARAVPAADYTVFVHWVDASGASLSQHDSIPAEGHYPTAWWLPGDEIPDVHRLPLPAPLPKEARLAVGLYVPETGVRLPAYDADGGRLPDDTVHWVWTLDAVRNP